MRVFFERLKHLPAVLKVYFTGGTISINTGVHGPKGIFVYENFIAGRNFGD